MSAELKEVSRDPQILYKQLSCILARKFPLLRTLVHTHASLTGVTSGKFSCRFEDLKWVDAARRGEFASAQSAVQQFGPENKAQIVHRVALLIELLRDDFVVELVADCRLSLECIQLLNERLEESLVKLGEAIVLLVAITSLLEKGEETQITEVVVLLANFAGLDLLENVNVHEGIRVIGEPTHKMLVPPPGIEPGFSA